MPEARRAERVKSLLRAQIIFNNHMSTFDCVIKNISTTGAKLVFADTFSIPSEFELHIPQRGRSYRARLVWRDSESMGVEFIQAASQTDADAAQAAPEGIEARLRQLQIQNAELKTRVRELSKRLEDLGQDPNVAA
jgi:uncharacterized protein YceH (UPF0502 family)